MTCEGYELKDGRWYAIFKTPEGKEIKIEVSDDMEVSYLYIIEEV
jgi:hypothetical protein